MKALSTTARRPLPWNDSCELPGGEALVRAARGDGFNYDSHNLLARPFPVIADRTEECADVGLVGWLIAIQTEDAACGAPLRRLVCFVSAALQAAVALHTDGTPDRWAGTSADQTCTMLVGLNTLSFRRSGDRYLIDVDLHWVVEDVAKAMAALQADIEAE